jgi:hypothetical protein
MSNAATGIKVHGSRFNSGRRHQRGRNLPSRRCEVGTCERRQPCSLDVGAEASRGDGAMRFKS